MVMKSPLCTVLSLGTAWHWDPLLPAATIRSKATPSAPFLRMKNSISSASSRSVTPSFM